MADIGGWWVARHKALPGEEVITVFYANYLRSEQRPLGGKLYLTDQRLLFSPHFIDSLFGGEKTTIDLRDITLVTREQFESPENSESTRSNRGMAEKLRIELTDGTQERFVVNDLDKAIDAIHAHVRDK